MGQFGARLNKLLVHADPTMLEHVKLFFLRPHLRHDITRRTRDQGSKTFNNTIVISQHIKARLAPPPSTNLQAQYQAPVDNDVQNVQLHARRNLPNHDGQGRPKCFYYHNYGHVQRHCRKLQQ